MSRRPVLLQNLIIGCFFIELVKNFKYIGLNINYKNNMHNEIMLRIVVAKDITQTANYYYSY